MSTSAKIASAATSRMVKMTALAGLSTNVLAQNKVGDLPRSIGEAGKRFRDRLLGITELTKSYLKGAKELAPKLNPFITLTEEEALKTAAILESETPSGWRNGNYRHGHFTAEAKEQRRRLRSLIREARKMVTSLV
jgi:hypothetical protein